MIPAATIAKLASLGLTAEQTSIVADMMAEVEAATEAKAGAAIEARRDNERARTSRYRERGGDQIALALRREVLERDGYACVYCGSEDHLQCDHVEPLSKGGATELSNLVVACRVCNARKKDRDRKYVQRHSADIQRTRGSLRTDPVPPEKEVSTPLEKQTPLTPEEPPTPSVSAPKGAAASRGTRIASDWSLDEVGRQYAISQGLTPSEVDHEAAKFRDFWLAKAGADGRKVDWAATWRTWARGAVERRSRGGRGPPGERRNPHFAALETYLSDTRR